MIEEMSTKYVATHYLTKATYIQPTEIIFVLQHI